VSAVVVDEFDRSAPLGMGPYKMGGNYAPVMQINMRYHALGHPITLFLDAKEHRYIEEFNSSNFVAITTEGVYVTPSSPSILKSITNASLMQLARSLGIEVQERPIDYDKEIATFAEVGAVGTAVIITPISQFLRGNQAVKIGQSDSMGPLLQRLYSAISDVQTGRAPDVFHWMYLIV